MTAVKGLDNMIANPGCNVQSGVVLLTGLPANFFNEEVPTLILRTQQDTLDAQAQENTQVQPNLGLYSIVLGSELLEPNLQEENKRESIENTKSGDESNSDQLLNSVNIPSEQNMISARPVTHIEIIRQKPSVVKVKHGGSRRVTGANRVVPLITSMWQKRELKSIEPSLAATYKTILDDPDYSNEHECETCHKQFLSATQVEHHIKEMHPQQQVVLEQCFVCRKKYVVQSQLKRHLSAVHGIQCPEMICKICFMEFNTVMEQKAHERKHDKIYSCQYCSTKFASVYFCQKHYDKHLVDVKPYQCSYCGKRFQNSISLDIHRYRHRCSKCLICHTLFANELELLMHVRDHGVQGKNQFLAAIEELDQEESQLEDMLGVYFKTSTENHPAADIYKDVTDCVEGLLCSVSQALEADGSVPESLADKRGLECKLCGLEVQSPTELVEHRRSNHIRSCTCLVCGKRSRSVSQTWRHIATHVDKAKSNETVYLVKKTEQQCHVCHKTFLSKGKKNFHLEHVHKVETIQRPHSCTVCSRKFQHKTSRDRHMLLHRKDKSGLRCSVCSQVFLRPKFLVRHATEHESCNECHICSKTFSSRRQLKVHLNGHSHVVFGKKFKCSLCSVTCQGVSGLREHMRIHTGERPFNCTQCEGRFKRLQALKKHISTVHCGPGTVNHPCASCPMIFNNRGNLLRHFLRIHRGLRRFICGLCGARYGQNQDLRRHLKAKHQVDMPVISCVDKKTVNEIYVLPPIDKIPESHPHAEKINKLVAEEKSKLEDVTEVIGKKGLVARHITPEDLAIQPTKVSHKEPVQSKRLNDKKYISSDKANQYISPDTDSITDVACSRKMDLGAANKLPEPGKSSFSTKMQLGSLEEQQEAQEVKAGSSVPLVGDVSPQFNSIIKMQTCSQCHKPFCEDTLSKVGSDSIKIICKKCTVSESSIPEKMLTLYRCGICFMDFFERDVLTRHMDEQHKVPPELIQSVVTKTSTDVSKTDTTVTNLSQGPATSTDMGLLCPPMNLLLRNIVLQPRPAIQTLPLTFTNQNILLNTAPIFTLQPSVLTTLSQSSGVITPKNLLSGPSVSLSTPAEVLINPGKVLLPDSVPEVAKPKLNSMNKAMDNSKLILEENPVEKTVIRKSNNESPKATEKRPAGGDCTCKQCGKKFFNSTRLERHLKTHMGERPFGCAQCGKHFSEKHNLKVHMRTHTGERPYTCTECGKQMRYQKDFADHKKQHLGMKPFECTECGQRFLRQRELVRHKITHTGEKKYRCPICDKAFARLDQLKLVHMRQHETKPEPSPFVCRTCHKRFRVKGKLEQHQILHSGQKNHHCPICDKAFALDVYLKSHLKTHKKQDGYIQCPKCSRRFASEETLQIHDDKFHVRMQRTAKQSRDGNKKKHKKLSVLPDTTLLEPEIDITDMDAIGAVSLLEEEDDILSDKCNTVVYLQMVPDLDLSLNNDTSE